LEWDVFISHASEDKQTVAKPLAEALTQRGFKVWYDEYELKIGDRLLEKIDEGLRDSRFGVVILSTAFFSKQWPKTELDGLVQKELLGGKVILPVWHNMRRGDVVRYSPSLAGRLAGTTEKGLEHLANEIEKVISTAPSKIDCTGSSDQYVFIKIDYDRLIIRSDMHRYALTLSINLTSPPAKKNFLLRLLWPHDVRVFSKKGIVQKKMGLIDNLRYVWFEFDYQGKLFLGDTIEVFGPGGRAELEYEFDDEIWDMTDTSDVWLYWEIYFEDDMPTKGRTNFKELNIY
jgi:hypothetical protein